MTARSGRALHWDRLYRTRRTQDLSWTQNEPAMSAALIDALPVGTGEAVVDVGGGAGTLVDHLLAAGHQEITVLDLSKSALELARRRVEADDRAAPVEWTMGDVLSWVPPRRYRLWHDRAVFHFLTEPADRAAYRAQAARALDPGGYLIVGTFAADGPTHCSGLPVDRYRGDELAAQFAPEFLPVTARDEHHHTPGGATQHFTWLVAQRR